MIRQLLNVGAGGVLLFLVAVPGTAQPSGEPFLLMVEEAFSVTGVGTLVTGTVARGRIGIPDRVVLIGGDAERATIVTAIESGRERVESAGAGETVAISLRGIRSSDVQRGYTVAAVGSVKGHVVVRAQIDSLGEEALDSFEHGDGRSGHAFVMIGPDRVFGERRERWLLPDGVDSNPVPPFDLVLVFDVARAVEEGWRVVLRRGGRRIATGVIREIIF